MASPTNSTQMVGVMPAPPGVTPDFYSKTPTQTIFIALFAVMWGLATLGVILRLYTRAFLVKNLGWDEPLLLASWIITFAFSIMSIKAMPAGFGRHMYEVSPEQLGEYLQTLVVLALTYIWPPAITKLSILVLYWRISPEKYFRTAVAATGFILISSTTVMTIIFLAPCDPNLGTPESAVCLNKVAIAQAVINIVTDVIIIVLPIPTIHSLHMPMKQKISVGIILGLGSAACIASIGRVAYVRAMVDNPDFTFTQGSAALWSIVEMNLGVICNCLAVMKPFLRRHMPYLMSASANTGASEPSYGKRSKSSSKRWGHSYQLHSVGNGKTDATGRDSDSGSGSGRHAPGGGGGGSLGESPKQNDITVDHQYMVEYDQRTKGTGTLSKGDSTDSILKTLQYPAHQPV